MSLPAFPQPIIRSLLSPGALATLMLPGRQNIFGTAQMDRTPAGTAGLGDFFPASSAVSLSRKEDASLLIPSLNVVLRVQVWPRERVAGTSHLHFECGAWSYLNKAAEPGPN